MKTYKEFITEVKKPKPKGINEGILVGAATTKDYMGNEKTIEVWKRNGQLTFQGFSKGRVLGGRYATGASSFVPMHPMGHQGAQKTIQKAIKGVNDSASLVKALKAAGISGQWKPVKESVSEARMASSTAGNTANRVYRIDDAREFVCNKPFTIKNGSVFSPQPSFTLNAKKGDTIFNLPGGIFLKSKDGKYPKLPAVYKPNKFGVSVTASPENIKAILANCSKVN